MRFIPKTEDEIASENLLPDGIYGFEFIEVEDTMSKKGNDMIHAKLKVYDGEGGFRLIDDYLLEAILYKVKHCADVCGLAEEYSRGEFAAADLLGKTGKVKIGTQQDKEKMYPPRNTVKDYAVDKDAPVQTAKPKPVKKPAMASASDDPFDDEIPF